MDKSTYLIVGNSAAAVGAVTGIRRTDPQGTLTILSQEKEHTYSRPLITYLLGGKVNEEAMLYRPLDFYKDQQINPVLGVKAESLDPKARVIKTGQGRSLGFERLLLATGGRPVLPPGLKGTDTEGVFTFTTWEDARRIKAYIQKNQVNKAVVIGGGLIGLKSVEALTALGIKVSVVEMAGRVLSLTLDETASTMVAQALEGAGVEVLCGVTVSSIQSQEGKVSGVTLSNKKKRSCGLVILAIGVVPDTRLARDAGIKVDRGILVDNRLMTNLEGIYAAGDVAQAEELLSGEKRTIPIWPNAFRQGFFAGCNMAGGQAEYEGGLAMNAVEVCGLATVSVGISNPGSGGYEELSDHNPQTGAYKKLVLQGNRLVGMVFVG
ncbi:MAG: FAD-dependent oxidoreductase, partial [Desulfarculaceae bacterium]